MKELLHKETLHRTRPYTWLQELGHAKLVGMIINFCMPTIGDSWEWTGKLHCMWVVVKGIVEVSGFQPCYCWKPILSCLLCWSMKAWLRFHLPAEKGISMLWGWCWTSAGRWNMKKSALIQLLYMRAISRGHIGNNTWTLFYFISFFILGEVRLKISI